MRGVEREEVGDILAAIYDSEIKVRIRDDSMWDGGFSWCLTDPGCKEDCLAQGTESTIEDAVTKLSEAIAERYSSSTFAMLWRSRPLH